MKSKIDLDINDLEILRAQKAGTNDLENLLRKIAPFVIALAQKWARPPLEPLDIAQVSLMKISNSIKTFKFESKFSTWVYTITYRIFLDESRKAKRRQNIANVVPLDEKFDIEETDPTHQRDERYGIAYSLLKSLQPKMQEVIIMIDIEGLSYEDAANALEVPVGTIRSRLARARIALKEKLDENGTFQRLEAVLSDEV